MLLMLFSRRLQSSGAFPFGRLYLVPSFSGYRSELGRPKHWSGTQLCVLGGHCVWLTHYCYRARLPYRSTYGPDRGLWSAGTADGNVRAFQGVHT